MFKDLKLKHRILLGYAIPLLLSVLVVIAVYLNVKSAERASERVETANASVAEIKDLHLAAANMSKSTRGYVMLKNEASLRNFENAAKEFRDKYQLLQSLIADSKQRENLRSIADLAGRLEGENRNLISLVNEGKQNIAVESFGKGESIKMGRELETLVREFEKTEHENMMERQAEENNAMRFIVTAIAWGTLLSIILAVAVGLFVSSRISGAIAEAANSVAASSTEIAATISQHERAASQQAAMVNETTTTVDELGASSRQSAEQAESAASVAQKASTMTEEGKAAVREAVDGMSGLKEKIGAVAGQILRLSEQTAQVGSIADLVADLAGQTNMLALNAAVEAARAGEHGRGFAVVAAEVRKLADQSKKSAGKANILIADIQKATNSTIMVTEEGTKTVEEITKLALRVGETFNSISSAANGVYNNAQQVLLNTRQQSAALGQVVGAINNINTGSRETAAGLAQTKIGVQKLNEAAQNLKAMV